MTISLVSALLDKENINVIVVGWEKSAKGPYIIVHSKVPNVGTCVGEFIASVIDEPTNLTVVGFGLGAHVAGYAGKKLRGQLCVIVELDPSTVLYSRRRPAKRLNSRDAKYVLAIHTNAYTLTTLLGVSYPIGAADFWPNSGSGFTQPGCDADSPRDCAQERAVKFFLESIQNNKFVATACDSYRDYVCGNCEGHKTALMAGVVINTTTVGNYYLNTNAASPYGQG